MNTFKESINRKFLEPIIKWAINTVVYLRGYSIYEFIEYDCQRLKITYVIIF